ncbi:MAG: thiosulfate oxidation carrier protein SoxY, partial [Lysobacteraceae bacterium]
EEAMIKTRRWFLQLAGGGALALLAAPHLLPRAFAEEARRVPPGFGRKEFIPQGFDEVLRELGADGSTPSADIELHAPEIAENGAVVPIEITSKLPGTRRIAILSDKNPHALTAVFAIPEGTEAWVSTRVKVAETSNVIALVQTDAGYFHTDRLVKVTLGGCGG